EALRGPPLVAPGLLERSADRLALRRQRGAPADLLEPVAEGLVGEPWRRRRVPRLDTRVEVFDDGPRVPEDHPAAHHVLQLADVARPRVDEEARQKLGIHGERVAEVAPPIVIGEDRKSTRLNSSHVKISYAVFCL